jgi:hypothetical protein
LQAGIFCFGHGLGVSAAFVGTINFYRQLLTAAGEIGTCVINKMIAFGRVAHYPKVLEFSSMRILLR